MPPTAPNPIFCGIVLTAIHELEGELRSLDKVTEKHTADRAAQSRMAEIRRRFGKQPQGPYSSVRPGCPVLFVSYV